MSTHLKISKYRTSWSKLGRDQQWKQQHGEGWAWPSGHRPWMQGSHVAGVAPPGPHAPLKAAPTGSH